MAVTADRLIAGVKRRITIPASQALITNEDILQYADDCIKYKLVPLIKSVVQDFFVTKTITELVADQREYAIPYRTIGRTLRDLKILDGGDGRYDIPLIAIEDEQYYCQGASMPQGHYFYGDRIAIIPTPISTDYSLEIWYELQPSELVVLSDAAVVVSKTATTVVVSSVPSTIVNGSVVDFIQGISGCSTLAMDKTITGLASTTLTFAADEIPSDLAAGDYVSIKQTSPVIQLPDEAYPLLETVTAMRCLQAISDYESIERLKGDEKEEEKNLKLILEPRNRGETTKIIKRNGFLRGFRSRLNGGYYY
jgi:uncharacterized membrane protein